LDYHGIIESPEFLLVLSKYLPPCGPFIAAFFLTYLNHGKDGMFSLLKRAWNIRFRRIWWIPVLFIIPFMEFLSVLLANLFGGESFPEMPIINNPLTYFKAFFSLLCLAMLEEYGWRGYALDRLQTKWNALISSLILAAFWGPWHLQQWFMGSRDLPFLAFWFGILLESILITWIYNNTKRSLLPVILVHALMNSQIFPTWENKNSAIIFVGIWIFVCITIIIFWKPKRFVRYREA